MKAGLCWVYWQMMMTSWHCTKKICECAVAPVLWALTTARQLFLPSSCVDTVVQPTAQHGNGV